MRIALKSAVARQIEALHERVKSGAYRALPSRRSYIPKEDGSKRPLAVAALEDKIVQRAVAAVEAMTSDQLPAEIPPARVSRLLTAAEFHRLSDVPPEVEWFANLSNPSTRRAYENAIRDFMGFTGIGRPEEFRTITRAHISSLGATSWPSVGLAAAPSGTGWRRSRRCSNISATRTPSPIIRSKASSGRGRKAAKARRRRSAITRRASC
jgi:hypothetical protein